MKTNKMQEIRIEKVVLGVGGIADELEKGIKLLKIITKRKPARMKTNKRIPNFGVRPKLEIGAIVTIRKDIEDILRRLLATKDNTLKKKSVSENTFSFGVKEYIEIPGVEYDRELGIRGFDVTITFKRNGKRVGIKKINRGKIPKKQNISKQEIIKFMEEKFKTKFI